MLAARARSRPRQRRGFVELAGGAHRAADRPQRRDRHRPVLPAVAPGELDRGLAALAGELVGAVAGDEPEVREAGDLEVAATAPPPPRRIRGSSPPPAGGAAAGPGGRGGPPPGGESGPPPWSMPAASWPF